MTRRAKLDTVYNFRDLGGYPAGGGATAWGRLWRSDLLSFMPDGDIEAARRLGIKTVVDLRSPDELERAAPSFAGVDGVDYINIPLLGGRPLREAMDESIREAGSFEASLTVLYQTMAARSPESYAAVFEAVAAGLERGGVVFYCTAGKDRTGMIAALLLLVCGVSRADAVADYRVSAALLTPKVAALSASSPLRPRSALKSQPETIEAFLDYIEGRGGAESFLLSAGLRPSSLAAIRAAMAGSGPLRRLPLAAAYNFRDLGGFAASGGETAWGRLWRSDLLGFLPDGDIEAVRRAGINTVVDLRSPDELERMPPSLAGLEGLDYINAPLLPMWMKEDMRAGKFGDIGERELFYELMPRLAPRSAAGAARAVIKGLERGGVVFYCAAGKDRTGILAALLLSAVGVSAADVAADYEQSASLLAPKSALLPEGSPLRRREPYVSDAATMERLLSELGDAAGYLRSAGLEAGELDALRRRLVEPER